MWGKAVASLASGDNPPRYGEWSRTFSISTKVVWGMGEGGHMFLCVDASASFLGATSTGARAAGALITECKVRRGREGRELQKKMFR